MHHIFNGFIAIVMVVLLATSSATLASKNQDSQSSLVNSLSSSKGLSSSHFPLLMPLKSDSRTKRSSILHSDAYEVLDGLNSGASKKHRLSSRYVINSAQNSLLSTY